MPSSLSASQKEGYIYRKGISKDILVKKYCVEKNSYDKVANYFGISKFAVSYWIKKYNIDKNKVQDYKRDYYLKGKTYEEVYGVEEAKRLKEIHSKMWIGRPPKNKGKGTFRECLFCNKIFKLRDKSRKFCSRYCLYKYYTGENNVMKRMDVRIRFAGENSPMKNNPKVREKHKIAINTAEAKRRRGEISRERWKNNLKYRDKMKSTREKVANLMKNPLIQDKKRLGLKMFYQSEEGKIAIQKAKERRALQIFPKKDSSIEIKIQDFLKQLEIPFFTHQYIKIEHGYQCDILIPSMKLVIECDGNYWHKYPIGNEIDNTRTKELIEKGFKVLRLWENEIKVIDLNKFKERLNGI